MDRLEIEKTRHNKAKINRWLESQRGRPQYRPTPKAGIAVNKVVKPLAKKRGSSTAPLREVWSHIIGSRLAKVSKPLRYASGRKGRTLIIEAPTAASAIILSNTNRILERIEAHIGPHDIAHIKVKALANRGYDTVKPYAKTGRGLTPSEEQRLDDTLATLRNQALKPALKKLGHSLLAKTDKKP